MISVRCRMCGESFNTDEDMSTDTCSFCGARNTLPMTGDDRLIKLFNRASQYRFENEYDRGLSTYEMILKEFPNSAEAHFGMVMCKFGLEYQEDSWSGAKTPVCHRAYDVSVYDDPDYKLTMEYCDKDSRDIYESIAYQINSQEEKFAKVDASDSKYDVYISVKEFDENDVPTTDSKLAKHLYKYFSERGYRVFLPSQTLKDMDYTEYEPYIYAALKSSRVLLAVTTQADYINWPWLKNEWLRFLTLHRNNNHFAVITCYDEMDPLDLPAELGKLPLIDMSKSGYENELYKRVSYYVSPGSSDVNLAPEMTIDIPTQEGNALGEMQTSEEGTSLAGYGDDELASASVTNAESEPAPSFDDDIMDSDPKTVALYLAAVKQQEEAKTIEDFSELTIAFRQISSFRDSNVRCVACQKKADEMKNEMVYNEASYSYNRSASWLDYARTKLMFDSIPGYKDADSKARECGILSNRLKKEEQKEQERMEQKKKEELAAMQAASSNNSLLTSKSGKNADKSSAGDASTDSLASSENSVPDTQKTYRILAIAISIAVIGAAVALSKPFWDDIMTFLNIGSILF